MSQPHGFWEQYKENLREYPRSAPRRILRIFVAFGMAVLLAPCCAAAASITGEPMAAMVVAVVGIVLVFIAWRTMLWMFDHTPNSQSPTDGFGPPGPYQPVQGGHSPFAAAFPAPQGFVDAQIASAAPVATMPAKPIMGASTGPVPPFAAEAPPRTSGAGWGCALAGVLGVMMLTCCGGGVMGLALLPAVKFQVGPNQANAGGPVGFPGPFVPPRGAPLIEGPNNDPFAEMHRQQQKAFDDWIRENERQMREMEEQIRQQNERAFGPGF